MKTLIGLTILLIITSCYQPLEVEKPTTYRNEYGRVLPLLYSEHPWYVTITDEYIVVASVFVPREIREARNSYWIIIYHDSRWPSIDYVQAHELPIVKEDVDSIRNIAIKRIEAYKRNNKAKCQREKEISELAKSYQ